MKTYDVIMNRRSIRRYKYREIPEMTLEKLLLAARAAPSAKNAQPWKFIIVRDKKRIEELGQRAVRRYEFFRKAPVVIAACGYPDKAFKQLGGYRNCVGVDVAIAVDHLTLAAWEEGIGTCWIGEFDEAEAKKVLNVPNNVLIVVFTTLGYPRDDTVFQETNPGKRKDFSQIVCYETYSD